MSIENQVQSQSSANSESVSLPLRLGFVSFLNDCSSEIISRTLPLYLTSVLGAGPAFLGWIEGIAESLGIFLRGFSGWLSDRMESRKPLVVAGYTLSTLSRFAMFFAAIPILLGLARVFERCGKGLRTAPRDAMVADAAALGRLGHSFGITRFMDTMGSVAGILMILSLGITAESTISTEMFRKIVWLSLPFGIAAIVVLWLFVPKFPRQVASKKYLSIHIPAKAKTYLWIVFVFSLGNSSDAFLVLQAKNLGYSVSEILLLFLAFHALAALTSIPVAKLSDRWGRRGFLIAGWMVYAAVYFAFATTDSHSVFAVALCIYGLFYGLTEGIEKALLGDLLPAESRGAGYGALQFLLGISVLLSSIMTGYLMQSFGPLVAFGACACLALIGSLALGIWVARSKFLPT